MTRPRKGGRLGPLLVATLATAAPLLGGCGSGDGVPNHSADEQKAVNALKNETPEQQIERIRKGPMPESAKGPMIERIKRENGLK